VQKARDYKQIQTNKPSDTDENKHQEAPKAKTKGLWLNNITGKSQSSTEQPILQILMPPTAENQTAVQTKNLVTTMS